jgi:hypothetical protein
MSPSSLASSQGTVVACLMSVTDTQQLRARMSLGIVIEVGLRAMTSKGLWLARIHYGKQDIWALTDFEDFCL